MRIVPDLPLPGSLSRTQESQRAQAAADQASNRASFESGLPLNRIKPVAPAGASEPGSGPKRERQASEDARAFAREAPNGPRPKYVPKGQTLNLLV